MLDAEGVERPAHLLYISPKQINFVVPPDTIPGFAIFNVGGEGGLVDGARSTWIAPLAPAFFTLDGSGQGPPAATLVQVQPDGTQVPLDLTLPIDLHVPGTVYLSIYGTGFREATGANCDSGSDVSPEVTYVGPQPTIPGLDQINLRLPENLKTGEIRCQFNAPSSDAGYASFRLTIRPD